MKVKELVAKLGGLDPEMEVFVSVDRNKDDEDQKWMEARAVCLVSRNDGEKELRECIGIH